METRYLCSVETKKLMEGKVMAKKETRGWVRGTRRAVSGRVLTQNMILDWNNQEMKIRHNVASRVEKYMLSEVGVNGQITFRNPCPTNKGDIVGIVNVGGVTYLVSNEARHKFADLDATSAIKVAESIVFEK